MKRWVSVVIAVMIVLAVHVNCFASVGEPKIVYLYDDAYVEPGTEAAKTNVYTQDDLYVLAHVICGEAQCYDDQEQLYVGSVVLNRVSSPWYPNTIRSVVYQKGQYACTWDGNYDRTPTERNWANALYLLENGPVLPANVVYQSGGRQGKGVYVRTKHHYYCYR